MPGTCIHLGCVSTMLPYQKCPGFDVLLQCRQCVCDLCLCRCLKKRWQMVKIEIMLANCKMSACTAAVCAATHLRPLLCLDGARLQPACEGGFQQPRKVYPAVHLTLQSKHQSQGNLLTSFISLVSRCKCDVLTIVNGSLLEYAEPVWLIAATAESGTLRDSCCESAHA